MRSRKHAQPCCRFSCASKNNCPATHPVQTGQSIHPCRHPAFPLCILPSLGAGHAPCTRPYMLPPSQPFPGSGCHRPGGSAPILPRRFRACCFLQLSVPPRHPAVATSDRRPACPDLSCCSAPWYGGRRCPPGRCLGRRLPGPGRHPLSIPFDGSCPYPLHPRQILDVFKGSVLSPVRDDRFGPHRPHVRQSLPQRRRVRRIDVDPIGREGHSAQQQSQHQRPARKPRSHCVTPCGSEPAPAGNPVEGSSVPRHIHTAYRPRHLHTAGLTPDVV